jgi:hypothetical protein
MPVAPSGSSSGTPTPSPSALSMLVFAATGVKVTQDAGAGATGECHRPHRALRQAAPLRALPDQHTTKIAHVRRRDRLGSLLHEYHQVA